ncbi:hypothetical protein [Xanthomonas albilineans]|uniref:hypothetical protein n=1 Tax=Xanthomonas albilineans TaxID=29447 RepID=UPI0005F30D47|nr:hypothetical protein [Xanthomonas albilineans]
MKPFVLNQHNKDFAALRTLRDEEMKEVYGGSTDQLIQQTDKPRPGKGTTSTVTPHGDGGDDGIDHS